MQAGWYADPSGAFEVRWHDGERWTEHVANRGTQATSPLPPQYHGAPPAYTAPPSAGTARPQGVFSHGLGGREISSSRQQLNVILLVLVIIVVLGSCAAMAGA